MSTQIRYSIECPKCKKPVEFTGDGKGIGFLRNVIWNDRITLACAQCKTSVIVVQRF
jgi:endogenous inhibitor of DNA gyrase (YacG/DUF329 family)